MPDINWNLLNTPNVGLNAFSAFKEGAALGKQLRTERETRSALSTLSTDPDNPEAFNALLMNSPDLAFRMRDDRRKQAAFKRDEEFRSALGQFGPPGIQPVASGELGDTEGVAPLSDNQAVTSQSAGGQDGMPRPTNARDAAFLRMWKIDPIKAMEIDSDMRDNAAKRVKTAREAYGWAIQILADVTDEQSYQTARKGFAERMSSLGLGELPASIPANYPGPEGVRQLLNGALEADKQLAAMDRRERLDWDIEDGRIDNDRQDRNTESLIDDRDKRRGLIARGQDITSRDRQRGQDLTDRRLRETGGGRGKASGGPVVTVKTPEEARQLAPGTVFRTPDGKLKVR